MQQLAYGMLQQQQALVGLQLGSALKPAAPPQQAAGQQVLFGQQPSLHSMFAAEAVALAAEQAAESSEDVITPANQDGQASAQAFQAAAPSRAAAPQPPAALPPPSSQLQQRCVFCGGLGTQQVCGPLRPATCDGKAVAVHHLCAVWSPAVYMAQGSSEYINLESEARRARQRSCSACGGTGASITCSHPGCRNTYHLPCALGAPNVLLEQDNFELWCPHHSDTDNSDEDYQAARPRRQIGVGAASKRQRGPGEVQRPRTDWQKRDENTWLKVVPPWWCEHRTVHFATKVYKELFKSAGSAIVVDSNGGEWLCLVQTEARNDMRPQYTLRGAFADLWEAQGICAGDTLVFKRDPLTGSIELTRHAMGSHPAGFKMDEGAGSEMSDPSTTLEGSGGRSLHRMHARQEASSELTRGQSQQGSHPNRWMELMDGWNIKTVYKSTMAHQQCPIAGWLFKKLYGRLPGDSDRAVMYDPDLDAEYRFDINFIGAANVHYIGGKIFSSWMRESGLQAGEQIRMKRDTSSRVLIQRVPSDRKVRVDFTSKAASRSASLAGAAELAMAGAPASHGQELASPPRGEALDALDALDTLVAAAGYAVTHGTPAIQAALAGTAAAPPDASTAAALAAAGLHAAESLGQQGMALGSMPPPPAAKRRRLPQAGSGNAQDLLLEQEQKLLLARRQSGSLQQVQAAATAPFSLADWQPSAPHVLMFAAINEALDDHEWSPDEHALLVRFRAKFAWLDGCGREMVYLTIQQLRADKAALLEFVKATAEGILTQLPQAGDAATPPAPAPAVTAAAAADSVPLPCKEPAVNSPPPVAAGSSPAPAALQQPAEAAAELEVAAMDTAPPMLEDAASFSLDLLFAGAEAALGQPMH